MCNKIWLSDQEFFLAGGEFSLLGLQFDKGLVTMLLVKDPAISQAGMARWQAAGHIPLLSNHPGNSSQIFEPTMIKHLCTIARKAHDAAILLKPVTQKSDQTPRRLAFSGKGLQMQPNFHPGQQVSYKGWEFMKHVPEKLHLTESGLYH